MPKLLCLLRHVLVPYLWFPIKADELISNDGMPHGILSLLLPLNCRFLLYNYHLINFNSLINNYKNNGTLIAFYD